VAKLNKGLSEAVRCFWQVRGSSSNSGPTKQGGTRDDVIGGKHCDGIVTLVAKLLRASGISNAQIHVGTHRAVLPGYFRPTKGWDLVVVVDGILLATLEVKSQVGSFGNNVNNRTEEVIGSGFDFQCAYKHGAFRPSGQPWLGYFILVEDCAQSTRKVKIREKHFPVFADFKTCSYEDRYRLLCERLVREKVYDAACFIMSDKTGGLTGKYREPCPEFGFFNFAASLTSRADALVKMRKAMPPPKA
jgi:hypothetical protein